jgi:dipeptidase D
MNQITNRFLELFYKISQIPRESGKEKRFTDFLEMFAKENDLECYRDKSNNVLIKKHGNKENNKPIILQAHIDMVCVKRENSNHNFDIDPIEVIKNGDVISAEDTSLGADQGIGLAIMLLLLESSKIKHPDLECLFTTEEETTFNGAVNFDYSKLNGKRLINLDHCKDDSIVIGCDADICNKYIFEGKLITSSIPSYKIKISNVKGGNSGVEIERSNKSAIMLLAKIIQELQKEEDVLICSISGGKSEGDIATSCDCIIKTEIKDIENKIKEKLLEDNIQLQVNKTPMELSFSIENSKKIINEIINLKQGLVVAKNNIITSGNVGIIETEKNKVIIEGILRSLEEKDLRKQNRENYIISKKNDFVVEEIYQDSAWIPNINSKLKEDYANIYYKLNGEYPEFEITHGGLECSCIAKRITGLDIISIGSIIEGCHTVNEKMYISSCEKTIKTLLAYLECENN